MTNYIPSILPAMSEVMNDLSDDPETAGQPAPSSDGLITLASGTKVATIWRGVARLQDPKSAERRESSGDNPLLHSSETFDAKLAKFEGAVREIVRPDVEPPSATEALSDMSTNIQVIVERAASLVELQSVIQKLQELHDFLHSEGERLEREISKYARINKAMTTSIRTIADDLLHVLNLKH